jgi:hypothetical protein
MEGVTDTHVPVFKREDYSPEMMAKYVRTGMVIVDIIIKRICRRYQLYASGKTEVFGW